MNRIGELRRSQKMSQKELGNIIGRDQSLISKLEKGIIDFDMSMADALSKVFKVPIEQLREEPHKKSINISLQPPIESVIRHTTSQQRRMVPVLGRANGGSEVVMRDIASPFDYVEAPPDGLSEDMFAIYADDRMRPKYRSGQILYIKNKPPSSGQDCFIELAKGNKFLLAEFVKIEANFLYCLLFDGKNELKKHMSDIKSIQAVKWVGYI